MLTELKAKYLDEITRLEASVDYLKNRLSILEHQNAELKQEILLLDGLKKIHKEKLAELELELKNSEIEIQRTKMQQRETMQQEVLTKGISEMEHKRRITLSKKFYATVVCISIATAIGFVAYSSYENMLLLHVAENIQTNFQTGYMIQNLRGDVVKTWVSWNVPSDRILHVDIVNSAGVSQDKVDAIKDAILSENTVQIDDSLLHKGRAGSSSTYYEGWEGALKVASKTKTEFYIPVQFKVTESKGSTGDIIITLSSDSSPDGYTGFTKSISEGHQVFRNEITIYEAQDLSANQIKAIARHEFGHAMGLAHSTASEDLMYATIQTDYPYISDCDIGAIDLLYNGVQHGEFTCLK